MKVALRDDDTCYFTEPMLLERVYGDVWDRAPVCLATVPHVIGYERPGIPSKHWRSGEAFALDRNGELVDSLRHLVASRRATIALHGYTHEDYPDGYEFQAAPDPERRIRDGLRHLRETLRTEISVFVPPHNALSKRGLAAVSGAGLNILGSFLSFRPSMRAWDRRTFQNWWSVRRFRRSTGRKKHDRFVYPHLLRYRNHAEFGCHDLIPGTAIEQLMRGFDEARSCGGHFCLATHHWEIDDRMAGVLRAFVDYAGRHAETRFVTVEELFQ